ncbi:MAG TPA: divergent polysaccharide deacetylase family protein [Vitreimonas sp.]|nr:divergent polysaccharide deacetylase family protein [Vitreimonas sp.]
MIRSRSALSSRIARLTQGGKAPPTPQPRKGFKIGHKTFAAGAFAAIVLAATISIQVFGDPTAAGPKGVISLAPNSASASTAPHISFSDAATEGSQMTVLGLDQLPQASDNQQQVGDIGSDGQLRVSIVQSPDSGTPSAPPASPLPQAPLAGLFENTANGPLPIVARNGRTPAQAYARPFTPQANHPLIAVVIGGLGFNAAATQEAIDELPPEITLSFVPYANDVQGWINRARAKGHEVMLELPMEPFDPDADDTGPQTLLASAPAQQNIGRLQHLLGVATGYFGVTNYQGARFATSNQASAPVVQELRRRGLVLVSSGIGQRTALSAEASRAGLVNTAADRIIDARREADAIDDQLLNLEALALQNQSAIGAGFAYPVTIGQVGHWAQDVSSRGYQLAPVSAVLAARARR